MKQLLAVDVGAVLVLVVAGCALYAQQPKEKPSLPPTLVDESKVPAYSLPDPLILLNGARVTDVATWKEKRRPEILELFANNVYGHTMIGRPRAMTWEVAALDPKAMPGAAIAKKVTIFFTGKKDGPKMELLIALPARGGKPAPVFLVPGDGKFKQNPLSRGYGLVALNASMVEPNLKVGTYDASIRKVFAPPGQKEPGQHDWGTIGAWAWAVSRAMDYLETDKDVDVKKVCVMGHSRFGKTAMWAGAQDERLAIVFSCQAGCGGATIVRRGYGETVLKITTVFPNWFAPAFKEFSNRVNDLPVDWHMLVALMAPRPVYISAADKDTWADPRGQFLAAKNAEPVYRLFGKSGLGVDEMPKLDTSVGDTIGYHIRKGTHAVADLDWQLFADFADRHFGISKAQ